MFNLDKKLSSILLCGSMAVTLLGNSGVHAADEIPEVIEDKSDGEVTAVDEHDDKVANDDKGNENTELDTNKEYQYVEKKDITAQNPAERSGSSAANAAKGLGTVALVVGMGVGAEEVVRRFKRDSSGNEAGGQAQAPIVSKDGTGVSTLQKKLDDAENKARELQKKLDDTESELQKKLEEEELQKKLEEKELQKKLEEEEKIYNFAYGAIGGAGYIPKLRDMVSSMFGRDFDVESKAAFIGMIVSYIVGAALFFWNVSKVLKEETKPNSITGWAYTYFKTLTDLAMPPVGFILQFIESILKWLLSSGKELSANERIKLLSSGKELSANERINMAIFLLKEGVSPNGVQQVLRNIKIFDENTVEVLSAEGTLPTIDKINSILDKMVSQEGIVIKKISVGGLKEAVFDNMSIDPNSIEARKVV